jgi:alpha-L-arabinofuranosidase
MGSLMTEAEVTLHRSFRIAPVPGRLFGSFVEHMGRCVYGGIYEPGHPSADPDGFRTDVLELARELGVSVVRYPGGNFVSGYRWEDGIGPRSERPVRLDRAWKSFESNEVGVDEFMAWVRKLGAEPMMAVNLGTRGVDAACDLLEYANTPAGTALSDLRAKHGNPDPYGIRLWCLGNEMDGPWQVGHRSAADYGDLARQTAQAMRRVDPDIELVVCGSSNAGMPTFGAWEDEVLRHTYDLVDYVSLHAYYEERDGDVASFLASAVDMDHMIDSITATADAVGARLRSRRRLSLSFDEWNVWYQARFPGESGLDYERGRPLIEDDYSALDAVVVGGLLTSLLRHCDRVTVACQAQLVNVIAPIRTEPDGPAWRQALFDPFALAARHARGDVLKAAIRSPRHDTNRFGDVDTLDAVATLDDDAGEVSVFLVNRSPDTPLPTSVNLPEGEWQPIAHHTIDAGNRTAVNSASRPDAVRVRKIDLPSLHDGSVALSLPPASWTLLHFRDSAHSA